MIKSRKEYHDCLSQELFAGKNGDHIALKFCKLPILGGLILKIYNLLTHNYINEFLRILRRTEYHKNNKGVYNKFCAFYSEWRLREISVVTGLSVPTGGFDKGLTIYHYGSIVVNDSCKIGRNCCIMNNVNIGANKGSSKAPHIGNNVYIGPGAVIFGDIHIADGCYIGANSVVCKDILEPYSVVVGSPAKVIKYETKTWWEYNRLIREK